MKKAYSFLLVTAALLPLLFFVCFFGASVLATGGQYAWSDKIGWINFNPDQGGVTISDSAITGYAWSQNFGWINLSPAQAGVGVHNTTSGTLSGYAWGQGVGWINFSGAHIDCNGLFTGTATGDAVGTINFICANCSVVTSWRPSVGCSTGGGTGPIAPAPPASGHGGGPLITLLPPFIWPAPVVTPTPTPPITPSPIPGTTPAPIASNPIPMAPPSVPPVPVVAVQINMIAAVSLIAKILSLIGIIAGLLAMVLAVAFAPQSLFELFLLPTRLLGLLFAWFGLKEKSKNWGAVYDSVTKQPLDPAYVVLQDLQGKEVATAITDLDGRYGFLAPGGAYKIIANKTNYLFPSQKLAGKMNDELYADLYFGGAIAIQNKGDAIIKNIPLDPLKFDWNEFAKKDKKLMRFYSRWNATFVRISDILFVVGFVIAFIAYFTAPRPYNTIIAVLYLLLLLLRVLGLKARPYGFVIDGATGNPLSFAIIHVMEAGLGREVTYKVADQYGRYYCLLPNGKYYVQIQAKRADGSYAPAYTSPVVDISQKGILKEKFILPALKENPGGGNMKPMYSQKI